MCGGIGHEFTVRSRAWRQHRSRGNEASREHRCQGGPARTLLLNLPLKPIELGFVNVYTPNSGAELARLAYRTGTGGWDDKFRASLRGEQLFGDHLVD